jgi:glyoxylase-like metal-dependent hydrolase (beta-lactamase superfamily II)
MLGRVDAKPAHVADGITAIDTVMAGERELNSVYLIAARQPCLVETGPAADGGRVRAALAELGVGADDLTHVVVTHIHMDHAGGVGDLLEAYPRAVVWVHERGAPHLADPARLEASTERTYGAARMRSLFGRMRPAAKDRIRAVVDGDVVALGDRALRVLHTPGHASHHVALAEDATGAVFTGEAIGSFLPWGPAYRPALPPPEVDVEAAHASIDAIGAGHPTMLLTSHFGPVPDATTALAIADERIDAWAADVRDFLQREPGLDTAAIERALNERARIEFERDTGRPFEAGRYDVLGSVGMNAQGLARYWRKRWEREGGGPSER